ncbi:MAG: hypothetical protein RJA98_3646 [Pseudomonadota bacterium]|jgi:chromosome segregation ATPase
MALGWMTLLKTVPWTDVIATAPAVADGAKKLWTAVSRKTTRDAAAATPAGTGSDADTDQAHALAALMQRLQALDTQSAELHSQLQASAALIEQLAAQNSELVQRVEAHRVRLRWLSAGVAALVVAAAGAAIALAGWGLGR